MSKLVRNNIPEIIRKSGGVCNTKILSDAEYLKALDAKLNEELTEYHESHSVEELADLLEVIYAVAAARGYTADVLDNIRTEKAAKRGRFERRIFLVLEEDE